MKSNFVVKNGDECLTSHSGLAIVGALLAATNLRTRLNETILDKCPKPVISNADIIFAMTGLICLGKPDYDAVEPYRNNPFFTRSLGLSRLKTLKTITRFLASTLRVCSCMPDSWPFYGLF